MKVSSVMTKNPVIIYPNDSLTDARSLMDKEHVDRLPVLDKNKNLVGILTRKDMLKAGPSAATTLDVYEIGYLLSRLTVEKIMNKRVITVEENEVIEEAARIMVDNDIGGLPVMKGPLLVGIITDSDLFRVFINALGARHKGVRLTLNMGEKPGQLAKLAQAIADKGGNIVAFMTSEGDDISHRRVTLKIVGIDRAQAENAIQQVPETVLEDMR